jgi:hypothetical protein
MTVRLKLALVLGALVSANLAVYGAKVLLSGALEPLIKALGA